MNYKGELATIIKPPVFCYSHTVQTPGIGATVTPSISISNDSDFEMLELRGTINKLAAFDGSVLLQLSLASGELFSNVGIDMVSFSSNNISNYSGYPLRFPDKIRIPANSVINVQITNNNAAALIGVQVQLWGYKVPSLGYEG